MNLRKERKNLHQYLGEYESFIDFMFHIYALLKRALKNAKHEEERKKILIVMGYFAHKNSKILPEKLYGPYTYVDCIFLGSKILLEETNNMLIPERIYNNILEAYEKSQEVLSDEEKDELLHLISF